MKTDLATLIFRDKRNFSFREKIKIALSVSHGLEFLHNHGLFHSNL